MDHGEEQHIEQKEVQPVKKAAAHGDAVEIVEEEKGGDVLDVGHQGGQQHLQPVAEAVPEAAAGVLRPAEALAVALHVLDHLLHALLIGRQDFLPQVLHKGPAVQDDPVAVAHGVVHHLHALAHDAADHLRQLQAVDLLHGGDVVESPGQLRGSAGLVGQLHGVLQKQHGEHVPVAGGDAPALQGLQAHVEAGVQLRLPPLGDPIDVVKAENAHVKALPLVVIGADFLPLGNRHAAEALGGFFKGLRQVPGAGAAEDLLGGEINKPPGSQHRIGGQNIQERRRIAHGLLPGPAPVKAAVPSAGKNRDIRLDALKNILDTLVVVRVIVFFKNLLPQRLVLPLAGQQIDAVAIFVQPLNDGLRHSAASNQ